MSVVVPLPAARRNTLAFEEQPSPCHHVLTMDLSPASAARYMLNNSASGHTGSRNTCFTGNAENLADLIAPGDVLQVHGNGHISQIGVAGGFMGHVMVVLARPCYIPINSQEALALRDEWPSTLRGCLWRVSTLESTRLKVGLHQADMLLHVDATTGSFMLCGEVSVGGEVTVNLEGERVVVWQSPLELRSSLRSDFMSQVLTEMILEGESWSMKTALRALFLSAKVFKNARAEEDLECIQVCWDSAPICTSVAVVFWQRYLCKLAHSLSADAGTELAFILKWMPLKGDRTLPGQLSEAMRECGWHCVDSMFATI